MKHYDDEVAIFALFRKDFNFLLKYCHEAIDREPNDWRPYAKLATVFSMLFTVEKNIERVEKSIEYRKKALALLGNQFPRRVQLLSLSRSYMESDRLVLAKEALLEAESEPRIQEEVRSLLLEIAIKEHDYPQAEHWFHLLPDDFEHYYRFGLPYVDKPALRKLIDEIIK